MDDSLLTQIIQSVSELRKEATAFVFLERAPYVEEELELRALPRHHLSGQHTDGVRSGPMRVSSLAQLKSRARSGPMRVSSLAQLQSKARSGQMWVQIVPRTARGLGTAPSATRARRQAV